MLASLWAGLKRNGKTCSNFLSAGSGSSIKYGRSDAWSTSSSEVKRKLLHENGEIGPHDDESRWQACQQANPRDSGGYMQSERKQNYNPRHNSRTAMTEIGAKKRRLNALNADGSNTLDASAQPG
jgi:hypothetical protein